MSAPEKLRYRMKIATRENSETGLYSYRPVKLADGPALGLLMNRAYAGTIDYEGESLKQCVEEISATLSGKYGPFMDSASFLVEENGEIISASLLTFWKEKPLLAYSISAPSFQGRGYAKFLIERSISALFELGHKELFLAVTAGNLRALHLYKKIGFQIVT